MKIQIAECTSPLGPVVVVSAERAVVAVNFADRWQKFEQRFKFRTAVRTSGDPCGAVARLEAYFAGDLGALDALPIELVGSDFQQRVWSMLRRIPVGTTWTYERLAREVGAPGAFRAVGAANGQNPISLVLPCHRVIGKDGGLRGYGGGLERKAWLLAHEGVHIDFARAA